MTLDKRQKGMKKMNKKLFAALMSVGMAASAMTVSADTKGVVTASALNVRQGAGIQYQAIDILPEGEQVSVVGKEDNWYKILYNDEVAYVYSDYIESRDETVQNETTEKTGNSSTAESVLAYAKNYLGVPYVYGGTTPSGFDCSGFVKYVYANFGINLPRVTYDQMNVGVPVSCDNLQVGDLLFFRGGGHVGIYAGNGTYIHAPRTGRTVSIDPLNRDVYAARRVL